MEIYREPVTAGGTWSAGGAYSMQSCFGGKGNKTAAISANANYAAPHSSSNLMGHYYANSCVDLYRGMEWNQLDRSK